MGYANEFPHGRMWDSDLREILEMFNAVLDVPADVKNFKEEIIKKYGTLEKFVTEYFDNLDVQNEINTKLNEMRDDGTLAEVINEDIFNELSNKVDANVRALRDRHFICIADSYGMNPRANQTWTSLFESRIPNTRQTSISSIGFTTHWDGDTPSSFKEVAEKYATELSEDERNKITDIVVCGGWNDARAITQKVATVAILQTKMIEFVDYCKSQFPNAIVHVGFIGWQDFNCGQPETTAADLYTTQIIYTGTRYKDLHNLSNVQYIMKNSRFMDSSHFHPNDGGAAQLYIGITGALFGGYNYDDYGEIPYGEFTVADILPKTSAGFTPFLYGIHNDILKMRTMGAISFTGNVVSNGLRLFQFNEFTLPCDYNNQIVFDGWFNGTINGNSYTFRPYIYLDNSDRTLRMILPESGAIDGMLWCQTIVDQNNCL